jgi:hypothetical protein
MERVPTHAIPKMNIRAYVRYTDREKFIPIIAAVYITIVPIVASFLPFRSEIRGMKVAENVHPIKKDIPMKAMVDFEAPKIHLSYKIYRLGRAE